MRLVHRHTIDHSLFFSTNKCLSSLTQLAKNQRLDRGNHILPMLIKELLALRTRVLVEGQAGMIVGRTREERPVYDVMMSDGRILKRRPREALAIPSTGESLPEATAVA